jgi:hypothetical protein
VTVIRKADLTPLQGELHRILTDLFAQVAQKPTPKNSADILKVASFVAAALHHSLLQSGASIQHSSTMLNNRGVDPADPEFYFHYHSIEDLLGMFQ